MTDSVSERVLILTPRGRDAELTSTLLTTHAMAVAACATPDELVERIAEGAGCAIVTSEVLSPQLLQQLGAQLAAQPAWSDFPLIVLVSARTRRDAWLKLGNVTILERPIAPPTLVTAVTAALRGRRRQYDARTAIQQRDQFLAMLGHELRNPLGAITLASDPLFVERGDHALLGRQLGVVARHAHHLRRLVDDLLDVARVTSGKVQLRREAVDIDAAIRECIEALEPRARERNIGFVTSTSGAVIEGDAGRIEQVITNLMTNAIKYSPAGRTITVAAGHDGETCEIRVRDQGVGIAPEMLPHVFELFAQADVSLDRSEGGMGIGLALVDRLVRLHGGTVSVTSEGLGAGSEFVVRLPVGRPPVRLASVPPEQPSLPTLHVVIVEDNPDLRFLTQLVLESFGCTVATACDGEEGLATIVATDPDLALVDVGLPKLDGYALASQVRQRVAPGPRLVAVTGYGRRDDRKRALAAGFDEHVTKPVSAETLRKLVESTALLVARRAGATPSACGSRSRSGS